MKKKMLLYLIMGCLSAAVLGGCGSKEQSEGAGTTFEAIREESEKPEKESRSKETEETGEEEEKQDQAHPPVLGEEDLQDYDGYAYLQWKLLTSDSGEQVEVYLPEDEDAYKSESTISGYNFGISYSVELDPFISGEDQKIYERLEDGNGGAAFGGSLAFDIPEEWSRDETESTDDAYVYAPYGDASAANCLVSISREYTGMDASEIEILDNNREFLVDMVKAELENEDAFDADVSFYEDTELGLTVKAQLKGEDEGGVITEVHMYWIFNEEYAYIISAAQHGDAALDDPFAVAEGILSSARME